MKMARAKRIEEIAIELTNQMSVAETAGELDAVYTMHEIFASMSYYKSHPEDLRFIELSDDKLKRKSIMAIVRGKKSDSKKTVLMIGHTDTVGISDYGNLKQWAHKPYELTEKFKELELPPEVKKDLDSGEYLFGRGLFDMKTGDAVIMTIMEELSDDIDNFEGNLIFCGVCDEEGNSRGMLSCVPELVKIQESEHLEYTALLDTDYMTSEYEGDENKYVYVGTVGKIMPTFYVVGKETHVGEAFKGLDPNQISAAIINRVNLNTEYCDVVDGEVSLPPITLKNKDLKPEYSCQIAKTAYLYFNYSTQSSTPDEVLLKMKKAAEDSFEEVIRRLNSQYEAYCKLAKREFQKLPWEPRVLTYEELYSKVKLEMGEELDIKLEKYMDELMEKEEYDIRDRSMKIAEYVHSLWSDRNPVVIVYFTPPYYPHVYVEGSTEKEKNLLNAVADAVEKTDTDYKVVYKKFFPYISDLSYASAPKDPKIIASVKMNMPGFGKTYKLPLEDMQKLDLPVLDIGAFGKDAHKFTERIEKRYSFEVTPELVHRTIMNLLK
ncbi:MAG: M20/M25/M40 family metallo-hydrolase [Proteocatella sp.]